VLINSVLWLESLDNYFYNRDHVQISAFLPAWLFVPSQYLHHKDPKGITKISDKAPSSSGHQSNKHPAEIRQPEPEKLALPPNILFAGDSLMQGVAPLAIMELKKLFPAGKYVDLSQQSTGLTARRYFDWPKKIEEESLREGFNSIVIFLGANDPWDIYEGKQHYLFPSDSWQEVYRKRVIEILEFAKEHHIHIIWVGLPNMDVERVKAGAMIQNMIFSEETKNYQFDYIDTGKFLGSFDEPFKKYINDAEKGPILIRGNDGVHFTVYGYRLISRQIVQRLQDKY
jgi:hypothetical protein